MSKTIICGSRSITDYSLVELAVKQSGFVVTEVVCGEARGVDRLGKWWAGINHVPVKSFPADWVKYGPAAGAIRNSPTLTTLRPQIPPCILLTKEPRKIISKILIKKRRIFLPPSFQTPNQRRGNKNISVNFHHKKYPMTITEQPIIMVLLWWNGSFSLHWDRLWR